VPDVGIPPPRLRSRTVKRPWVPPLLRRILLVNALPLALLVAALLYLDQYQNGLLQSEVTALREQARIYAGALGESAVKDGNSDNPTLVAERAQPLLRRLTDPTPNSQAKLYGGDGQVIADSRVREGTGGAINTQPLPPPAERGEWQGTIQAIYDEIMSVLPHEAQQPIVEAAAPAAGVDWQPDVKAELRLTTSDQGQGAPYIRRTQDNRLLVTVVEPVQRNRHTVGIIAVTRDAREVDDSLAAIRSSILGLFVIALVLTVMLSWYLSLTIARPILLLTDAAHDMREGHGRAGTVPRRLLRRSDEIGELAAALHDSSEALWSRMDATEQFAADVAHEIKNPLSSIRSAIETLARIEDPTARKRLLAIITEDVMRLDRLISDISDASRVDAELSRAAPGPVNVGGILNLLAEIDAATGSPTDARLVVAVPDAPLLVQAVEDRLVQVLRNLIGNAQSFSPEGGTIVLRAAEAGGMVEIGVEDQGPGMPEARLEHVFDRFYSERPHGERFGQHSGLGLSISRQIVEALKGSIAAENRRDAMGEVIGARFVVRLPKA
jgi:two-component system, OmpR family, sensor histidine kinase ChvG